MNTKSPSASPAKKSRPVILWASLGALFLVLQTYVYSAWMLSDAFHPVDVGPDPLPPHSLWGIRIYEVLSVAYLVIVIPWFFYGIYKSGKIDHFRLMMLGFFATWWTDPWLNFLRPMFTYNAYAVNRGCWCEFMPFWQSENGHGFAEPLLIVGPAYFWTFALTTWSALWVMHKARNHWPTIGNAGLCLAAFIGVWISMGTMDVFATRVLYFDAWPGAFQSVAWWGGNFYQFPIYEFIFFPSIFVVTAFVIYYADKNGETVVDRGIHTLGIRSNKLLSLVRILAFVGLCNVANLIYTTVMGVHALYVDPWPAAMPSWLQNEQCGATTGINCDASPTP